MNGIRGLFALALIASSGALGLSRLVSAGPAPVIYSLSATQSVPQAPATVEAPSTQEKQPVVETGEMSLSDFSEEEIAYFREIVVGSEFVTNSADANSAPVRRWKGPIMIQIKGTPDQQSIETVNQVVAELKELTGLDIQLVEDNPNITIHFAPEAEFSSLEHNYRPRNMGFFWTWWEGETINRANVLISTTEITPLIRAHLIREELTQSLGLMKDSPKYTDSIFFGGWTMPTQENPVGLSYTELDKRIIQMLYRVPMEQLKTLTK